MQALGLIETRGLVVAIESADAMLKAADVILIEKTYVGGGLVTIAVAGEVAAVKAAVEAGTAAVRRVNSLLLVSQHVIPRPDEDLDGLIVSVKPLEIINLETSLTMEDVSEEETLVEDVVGIEKRIQLQEGDSEGIHKDIIDHIFQEYGLEEALEYLGKLKVIKLRNLAREYKKLGIEGRLISKANKKTLLTRFTSYYYNLSKINY